MFSNKISKGLAKEGPIVFFHVKNSLKLSSGHAIAMFVLKEIDEKLVRIWISINC